VTSEGMTSEGWHDVKREYDIRGGYGFKEGYDVRGGGVGEGDICHAKSGPPPPSPSHLINVLINIIIDTIINIINYVFFINKSSHTSFFFFSLFVPPFHSSRSCTFLFFYASLRFPFFSLSFSLPPTALAPSLAADAIFPVGSLSLLLRSLVLYRCEF